jgi:septum formation inhibitor-activating ATPase MinD
MQSSDIKCVLYSLGYGIYLVDLIMELEWSDVIEHLRETGLYDVMDVIPRPNNDHQGFVITKHGRPPCILEKNQVDDKMLEDIDTIIQQGKCKSFIQRAVLLRQEFPVVRLIQ